MPIASDLSVPEVDPGVASTRLQVGCAYGFGVAWSAYHALGWKPRNDRDADADLALQVEATAMLFDKRLGQRQSQAGTFELATERAVPLTEPGQRLRDIFGRNADWVGCPLSLTASRQCREPGA